MALITDAKNEALKAKEDEGRRVNDQAKRLDHITRALRIEASEVIAAKYNEQMEIDRQAFQSKILELVEESKKQHTVDLEEKQRLSKMQPLRAPFEEDILAKQRAQYEKRCQALKNKALKDYRDRKVARARKALQDELERTEMEAEAERERQGMTITTIITTTITIYDYHNFLLFWSIDQTYPPLIHCVIMIDCTIHLLDPNVFISVDNDYDDDDDDDDDGDICFITLLPYPLPCSFFFFFIQTKKNVTVKKWKWRNGYVVNVKKMKHVTKKENWRKKRHEKKKWRRWKQHERKRQRYYPDL